MNENVSAPDIVLVAAIADNGVIGRRSKIPWHIPGDLARFKALTLGKPVVMGRRTWDSLPKKPLPGRTNIVVTRDIGWRAPGAMQETLLDKALDIAAAEGKDAMVIGGAQIYRALLPRARRIELTEVHRAFEGDATFIFDREDWIESAREDHATADGLRYSYVTLTRRT